MIDPRPFVSDPAYDATQHLLYCFERRSADPVGTTARFAGLLHLDREQVRRWLFAGPAARLGDEAGPDRRAGVARAVERAR